jgi:hypothetical protein
MLSSMTPEEARDLLRKCQRDRKEAREMVTAGQATVESAQLIIQGILKRFPDLAVEEREWEELWEAQTERPRGAQAVLSVLQVDENQWYTVVKMVDVLAERGWLPPESENPANAVRTALERLVAAKDGNVEKSRTTSGTVIYRYHEPEEPSYDDEPF